jgi:hypothetical protein
VIKRVRERKGKEIERQIQRDHYSSSERMEIARKREKDSQADRQTHREREKR